MGTPTLESFRQFVKAHRDHPVLSVYVGGGLADVAEQRSWLVPLRQGLRRARAAAEGNAEANAEAFPGATAEAYAACERAVLAALPGPHALHEAGGWCVLAAATGRAASANGAPPSVAQFVMALPAPVATLVRWQAGAVVLPFLAAAPEVPVLVLQLERDHARLVRLAGDAVTELARDDVALALGAAAHMGDAPRQGFHTGTRGEALTDLAQRRLLEARQQLLTDMLARATAALPAEGVLLLGGAEEVGRHARSLLPEPVAARTAWSPGLRAPLPDATLGRAARAAAAAVRDTLHQRWLDRLREEVRPHGRGAAGPAAVRQALALGAVERLLLGGALLRRDPAGAEAMARDATLQGGTVVVADRDAGDRLEHTSEGVAALLRFPVPVVAPSPAVAGASATAPARTLAGGPA